MQSRYFLGGTTVAAGMIRPIGPPRSCFQLSTIPLMTHSHADHWHRQDYEALLFDCDGTLADTMPAHYQAWLHVTEMHGIVFDEDRFYALGGRPTRDIVATLAREAAIVIDIERAAQVKEGRFLAHLAQVQPIDPVIDVVRRSRDRIPMAVVTGGHAHVCKRILEHVGIGDCFQTLVACEDTSRHKPDPDPFLEAAHRLRVRPERCLVWEDSDLGIEAARRAGMDWIDVRGLHSPRRLSGE
jgi:HAD superfamily hydrolase (TIGR01509 family)